MGHDKTKPKSMKNMLLVLFGFILLISPLPATAQQYGDFTFYVYPDGFALYIAINGYLGYGGSVDIPDTIYGLPVGRIEDLVFDGYAVTSVTIPASVGYIGYQAFSDCSSLIAITVSPANQWYNSADGVLFDKYRTTLIQCPGGKAGSYSVPSGVASIGDYAFAGCVRLTSIVIPGSVADLGSAAFAGCSSLKRVFFKGGAPSVDPTGFDGANTNTTVYYLPGTIGWGATFAGRPAVLWNPLMQTSGVGSAGFGLNITGTADIPIVIEAATSLANTTWVALQSLNLTNGAFFFSDPNWTNYPTRFYRIRSP
jgi:hypothetical protein